jgi:hypothetical protein
MTACWLVSNNPAHSRESWNFNPQISHVSLSSLVSFAAACTATRNGTTCQGVAILVKVYFANATNMQYNETDLSNFLKGYCTMFTSVAGIDSSFNLCATINVAPYNNTSTAGGAGVNTDTGNTTSGNTSGGNTNNSKGVGGGNMTTGSGGVSPATMTSQKNSISSGGIAGIAFAGLSLALVAILVVRQSQRKVYSKNRSMGGLEDETYLKDDFDGSLSPCTQSPSRREVVIGEGDSAFSTCGGYGPDQTAENFPSLRLYGKGWDHGPTDVHMCSSATCDVCEGRRQGGLQFIPSGMPSQSFEESIPYDAERSYHLESNTVDL